MRRRRGRRECPCPLRQIIFYYKEKMPIREIWENSSTFDIFRNIRCGDLKGKCSNCEFLYDTYPVQKRGPQITLITLIFFIICVICGLLSRQKMSIFIKIDILKPSLIQHFKKKVSIIINIEQKSKNYAI